MSTARRVFLAAAMRRSWTAPISPSTPQTRPPNYPAVVTRAHVELFQTWMSTPGVHRGEQAQQPAAVLQVPALRVGDRPIAVDRIPQPKTPRKLIPAWSRRRTSPVRRRKDDEPGMWFLSEPAPPSGHQRRHSEEQHLRRGVAACGGDAATAAAISHAA
jgi:hypothetical protein